MKVASGQVWTNGEATNRIMVGSVARDGSWANILIRQIWELWEGHDDTCIEIDWKKRVPLPFPSSWRMLEDHKPVSRPRRPAPYYLHVTTHPDLPAASDLKWDGSRYVPWAPGGRSHRRRSCRGKI
jgi:hypothetical protein